MHRIARRSRSGDERNGLELAALGRLQVSFAVGVGLFCHMQRNGHELPALGRQLPDTGHSRQSAPIT